jgi:hypothetical protein
MNVDLKVSFLALLPGAFLPPMSRADAFVPERAIAAELLPAADAVLEGRPFPA